jgi:Putative F0F1-ATPase subunit Ca2+/Mg2+ transporter
MPPQINKPNKPPRKTSVWEFAGMAGQMLAAIGVAVWAGIKLDEKLGLSFPAGVIIFPLIALGVILWQIIKATQRNG